MAAFRRCVIALAVLAVFAGLASAQAPQPMTCNLSTQNATVRGEGKTELLSDLLITCNGGSAITGGTLLTTVNFTLTLGSAVTSRVVSAPPALISDALLLIDDPGTVPPGTPLAPGFGQNAVPTICSYAANPGGCPTFAGISAGFPVMSTTSTGTTVTSPNVYQGVLGGSGSTSITFFGVPVLPPSTTGAGRTYRLTNVRFNASAASAGPVNASLTVQGGGINLITLNQTTAVMGTVAPSLKVAASTVLAAVSIANCVTVNGVAAGTVSFSELFASAFRTRVLPGAGQNSAQSATNSQTVPGSYFTESGYELALPAGSTPAISGVADFGTRLKAIFNNIPTGVRVFVSLTNDLNASTAPVAPSIFGTAAVGANNANSLAQLITGAENGVDGATGAPLASAGAPDKTTPSGTPGFVELTVVSGSATAVWEVLNTNTAANETFTFNVWATVPANTPVGQSTVNLSYAPAKAAGSASDPTTGTVPGFVDPSGVAVNSFSVVTCRSVLLYPFLTSNGGFDSGVVVTNASVDTGVYVTPTTSQSGTCQFYLYGTMASGTVPGQPPTPSVAGGTTFGFLLSTGVDGKTQTSGFTGYGIAVCNFQYAHGFTYIIDWQSPTVSSAMGYLALVMPNLTVRGTTTENGAANLTESLIH